jgi:hypothetical protein
MQPGPGWERFSVTAPLSDAALRGRVGAYTKWANTADRSEATAPARSAFLRRFEKQVDPQGLLGEVERARRAQFAMRAYMADLSRRRTTTRRSRRRLQEQARAHDGQQR